MRKIEKDFFNSIRDNYTSMFNAMIDIVDLEMTDGEGFTPLLLAAYNGNIQAVNALIKRKVNINAYIKDGDNALHFAAYNDYEEIAKVLIKAGIDINLKGYEDRVPITLAITEDSMKVFRVIYKENPDMYIENDVKRTPIVYITLKPDSDKQKFMKIMKGRKVGKFADLLR